jgi:hypothetical protein
VCGTDAWHPNVQAIYDAAALAGVEVERQDASLLGVWRLIGCRSSRIHCHWLEPLIRSRRRLLCAARMIVCFGTLAVLRVRRVQVVWTVHNVVGHDHRHPRLEWAAQALMVRLASTLHVPHVSARAALRDRLGSVVDRKAYSAIALPTLDVRQPRRGPHHRAGRPGERCVLAFGAARPYKGTREIVAAFRDLPAPDARLVVAGPPADPTYAAQVEALAADDARISVCFRRHDDREVARLLEAADWMALGYGEITNSGVLTLAMTYDVPVVGLISRSLADLVDGALLPASGPSSACLSDALERAVAMPEPDFARCVTAARAVHARLHPRALAARYRSLYTTP